MATPQTEERLLAVGRAGTAEHVELIVRGWRKVDRQAEAREALYQKARAAGSGDVPAGTSPLVPDISTLAQQQADALALLAETRVIEVGARTRTIPPALRRALQHRDRGCRFPGCGMRFGQGHHIRHWAQGGPTTLSNLTLLCRRHHRAVHEEGPAAASVNDDPVQTLRSRHVAQGLISIRGRRTSSTSRRAVYWVSSKIA